MSFIFIYLVLVLGQQLGSVQGLLLALGGIQVSSVQGKGPICRVIIALTQRHLFYIRIGFKLTLPFLFLFFITSRGSQT